MVKELKVIAGVKGTTLIMPSPGSIGFLGSLSADILISTFELKRIGELDAFQLEQLIGTKVYNESDVVVHSALEVYQGPLLPNITVLQVRSTPFVGYAVSFAKSLSSWIVDCDFKNIIMLTGLDKAKRVDSQITSSPLRYFSNFGMKSSLLDLRELEPTIPSHQLYAVTLPPGSGCGQFILNFLGDEKRDCTVLSYFTESGDNNIAAHELADATVRALNIESTKLTTPPSWIRLYGDPIQGKSEIF